MAIPGGMELLIIGGIIVLLFGGSKLPKLGGAIGESIKNFKKGVKDPGDTKNIEAKKDDESDKNEKNTSNQA